MNVKEILSQWLKENGYTGLCNMDCGCPIEDIGGCECAFEKCEPAHEWKCIDCLMECPDREEVCYRPEKKPAIPYQGQFNPEVCKTCYFEFGTTARCSLCTKGSLLRSK